MMLSFLWKPQKDINYDFIFSAYILASILFIILFILDKVMKYQTVEGSWIILAPFIPCLFWVSYVRSLQQRIAKEKSE